MIASISGEGQRTKSAPFGHALVALADSRPDIVGLSADLSKYTDLHIFAKAHPDRFFQMGMAEQLLMGAAGGMAKEGFTPFVTTYAVFATRRAYDFIHQVIAEEHLNVKICAALPGLTTGYGPSHQATEDLAIMRGVPGLTIVDPCDALDTDQAVRAIADHHGPVYMRLLRGNVPLVLDEYDYKFELGKAKLLREPLFEAVEMRKHQSPGPDPFTMDEVEAILAALPAGPPRNYFEVAFFTGLRPSELIALRWSKVDKKTGYMKVDAALTRFQEKGTKTWSARNVELSARALQALERQRAAMGKRAVRRGTFSRLTRGHHSPPPTSHCATGGNRR